MKYDQPFYVGRNNPRFRGIDAFGYLPPLEPPVSKKAITPLAIAELFQYLEEKIKRLDDLQGRMIHLQNKLNEHLDKKKRSKY